MEKYILAFDEIKKQDVAIAGGKGANLGEMTNAGIPVPPGAVLCAAAYDKYMEENKIDTGKIMELAESDEAASANIREAIRKGRLPEDIKKQIVSFYETLGGDARVAVRSSATAEDLEDASFAGQQETYLNVVGTRMLLEKVQECYASLWGNRAISYRKVQGYDKQKVSLAVVIQQMIESESAGVLFTRNPAANTDDVLINASYGLGEAVVSGIVSPDEYICDRNGKLKKSVIGSKEIQIIYDAMGTKKVSVSGKLRREQVLDAVSIRRLVSVAMKIEAHYGHPMDIEWAIRDGKIYILQARSITTTGEEAKILFDDEDFAGLPKAVPARGRMRENVLFNLEKLPKPYYPLDHDFGDAVGKQKEVLILEMGIRMNEMCPINDDGISSFSLGGMKPTGKIFHLPGAIKQMKNSAYNIRVSAEKLTECQKRFEEEKEQENFGIREIGESLSRMRSLIVDTAYARFRYAIFPQVVENISLNKTLGKVDKNLNSFDLMEGLSYVTADINREMDRLARNIRSNMTWLSAVMTLTYGEITRDFPELGAEFDKFMEKYGNRSDFNCYCFVSKSWKEDPDRFLGTLRTMLRSENSRILGQMESEKKFASLMEKAKRTIGDKAYQKFEKKVKAVRHYHYIREATQYLWESEFAYCRLLLQQASSLLKTGYEDLLYLFADEFFEVCRAGALTDQARGLIEKRKGKRPLAEAYWSRSIAKMLAADGSDITGVSGSVGKAVGSVRVIKSPEEFDKLQAGEILVCTYTDPEWTPLFTLAAGVVVDTGGTLSHAAIVAREYKIPAVLATGNATEKLKDGDMVIVDGTNGTVVIAQQ